MDGQEGSEPLKKLLVGVRKYEGGKALSQLCCSKALVWRAICSTWIGFGVGMHVLMRGFCLVLEKRHGARYGDDHDFPPLDSTWFDVCIALVGVLFFLQIVLGLSLCWLGWGTLIGFYEFRMIWRQVKTIVMAYS